MENLKQAFEQLSPDDKVAFIKWLMPVVMQMFMADPQKMMQEMMPVVQGMMGNSPIDLNALKSKLGQ